VKAEDIAKWIGVVNAVLWAVLLALWIRNALFQALPASLLGLPLYPALQVEEVARYIVGMLYAVFKWTLVAVVIIAGIGAALGLVSEYVAFIGIRVPRASLRTLLSNTVQLVLMKVVVDAALRYFGYAELAMELEAALWGTWLGYLTVALGAVAGALLLRWALRHVIELKWR